VEREFPAGASELLQSSRRGFLQVMGASLALAGAAVMPGCRRPEFKILPYSKNVPEDLIPGKPLFYTTSMPLPGGGAEGLLIETHEGRPTKVEGNPLHPINQGKSSVWAQASILSLYDPDRLLYPVFENPARGKLPATWDDFRAWAFDGEPGKGHIKKFEATQGAGLALLIDKQTSPTRAALKARFLKKYPKAMWIAYDPTESRGRIEGTAAAFGKPMRDLPQLAKCERIVSLDRDFLSGTSTTEPTALPNARGFASRRAVDAATDLQSRLYMVESEFSITGSSADHRLRLAPSRIPGFAVLLARALMEKLGQTSGPIADALKGVSIAPGADLDDEHAKKFATIAAEDLAEYAGRAGVASKSLVLAGASQPAAVHALTAAMNAALGAIGQTVLYRPMGEDEAADSAAGVAKLVEALNAGAVDTLVCIHTNPAYDAAGSTGLREAIAKAKNRLTLSVGASETASASTWSLNSTTYLEQWGDLESADGTISPVQPMIAPIYEPAMSDLEFIAMLTGEAKPVGYELVRGAWRETLKLEGAAFETQWKRALQNGVLAGTGTPAAAPALNAAGVAKLVAGLKVEAPPSGTSLDVVFRVGLVADGRLANVSWLQELPDPATKVVWDNPACVSPATGRALGIEPDPDTNQFPEARMVKVSLGGRSVTLPVWVLPGMADNTLLMTFGYGRTGAGKVGDGVGFNVAPLFALGDRVARGATIEKTGASFPISTTQHHWSMEGRTTIVRQVDQEIWNKRGAQFAGLKHEDPIYGTAQGRLNFAEQMGELSHTPPNLSIYVNPYNGSLGDPDVGAKQFAKPLPTGQAQAPNFARGPQWGMTIDLSTCTGCNACTIACQAENNIPVVGKKETQKGREMAWIRVDRYFLGESADSVNEMVHQPIACVHCENAPCEVVCPVNATIHSEQGLNVMAYNRCIGTRYCANNCPYKVRRFNFFDYATNKYKGAYYGQELLQGAGVEPENLNLIPPRLRSKLDEITRMGKNPDVTVRSRGVMEKCTYCIQRINAARVEMKLRNPAVTGVPDGFFQTACQQACPSESIVFGDILDRTSKVYKWREHERSYALLGYLNTRPRTTHLVRVVNTNPKLRTAPLHDPFNHGSGQGGGEGGGGAGHGGGHSQAPSEADKVGFRHDRRKLLEDVGYRLSLTVI
jgi:molybdopterin-containing oxidoreductase family iron-sulfur binding subunit